MLFDWLVIGHALEVNPTHAVRGPKHSIKKGKTPVLDRDEARAVIESHRYQQAHRPARPGVIATMVYTFARIGAVLQMDVSDYFTQGRRGWVRLYEKGGKEREALCITGIPRRMVQKDAYTMTSPRTTKLYDRRNDGASLDEYEKVGI